MNAAMSTTLTNSEDLPALAPPPGVISNFVNPPSLGDRLTATLATCLSLSTIFVSVRIYTRLFIIKPLKWDDFTCLIAWLGLVAYAAILIKSRNMGLGIDQWNLSIAQTNRLFRLGQDGEIVYKIVIFFTKLSILLLYLRLFVPDHGNKSRTYIVIQVTIWMNLLFYVAVTVAQIFQCKKLLEHPKSTHCVGYNALPLSTATVNVVSDVGILLIPFTVLRGLQMPLKRKLALSAVFAVGAVAVASSVVRLVLSVRVMQDQNETVLFLFLTTWTVGEITSGIIVGCAPLVSSFFRHVYRKSQHSLSRTQTKMTGYPKTPTEEQPCGRTLRSIWGDGLSKDKNPTHRWSQFEDPDLQSRRYIELESSGVWPHNDGIAPALAMVVSDSYEDTEHLVTLPDAAMTNESKRKRETIMDMTTVFPTDRKSVV